MTMQISFVAKAKRIRNRKDKEYYIHRLNIPAEVAEELDLGEEDYLLINAQKAEWYHLLDWTKMQKTWAKLPSDIKSKLIASRLFPIEEIRRVPCNISANYPIEPARQVETGKWTTIGSVGWMGESGQRTGGRSGEASNLQSSLVYCR